MSDAALPEPRRRGVLGRLARRPLALLGLLVILATVLAAIFAPWLAPFGRDEQLFEGLTLEGAPMPPGGPFLLGTDLLGRDLLTRILYGARTSLVIGVVANGMALLIGTLVGVTAGYFRGWMGSILMRFTDLMMAFPALLLAICLAAIFTPSLWIVALVIALVNWVQVARVLYTETTSLAERDFIAAERAIGRWPRAHPVAPHPAASRAHDHRLGHPRHLHHRPLEATLSFFGIGVQPPQPSWGNIIFENQTYFQAAPWLVIFPGLAILLLGAGLQPPGRRASRRAGPYARGDAADGGLPRPQAPRVGADPLGSPSSPSSSSTSCPPIRCARSPDARHARDGRERSAASSASTSPSGFSTGATFQAPAGRPWPLLPPEERGGRTHLGASVATLLLMAAAIICELVLGLTMGSSRRSAAARPPTTA
jgi:peptide/nickel transport system permease protein